MIRKFFSLPGYVQLPVSVLIAFFGGFPLGISIRLCFEGNFYLLLLLPFTISLSIFTSTPLMRVSGYYKYYSPMLLGIKSKKKLDLHNGTSFDYFLHMKLKDKGTQARYKILAYYFEGLLNIISEIENGKINSALPIEGTSYFFSDNTAVRLGFKLQKPVTSYYLNFIFTFVDLCFMYSYSKGKFTIPRIFSIKRAVISAEDLCNRKEYMVSLLKVLNSRIKNS
jgi:hypothetical protein